MGIASSSSKKNIASKIKDSSIVDTRTSTDDLIVKNYIDACTSTDDVCSNENEPCTNENEPCTNDDDDEDDEDDSNDKPGNNDNKPGNKDNNDNKPGKNDKDNKPGNNGNKPGNKDNNDNKPSKNDNKESRQINFAISLRKHILNNITKRIKLVDELNDEIYDDNQWLVFAQLNKINPLVDELIDHV